MNITDSEKKLTGGVAVITGAGAGIGSAFALRAAELGMTVVVTDVSASRAEAVAKSIREKGGKAEHMAVDVSVPSELEALAEDVFARHGRVRLLINNAGIETLGFSWEIPASRWDATLDINVKGVIHGVRAFAPRMIDQGEECWIANLASIGAFSVFPTQTAYIVTKHAVQAFSEGLFLEMQIRAPSVHVCSVIPGMLKTSIFDGEADSEEPASAATHRQMMHHMMHTYGMDLDEGCRVMMAQIAEGKFWVSSQPKMTAETLAQRVEFLRDQQVPKIAEASKHLLRL
ncbi:short-chain dehydrogenase/reductase SDR [Ilyonectria destructans]|nr:short-chain dehydrogenase/reductase SDR [Ilyonectria destructans]